MRLNRRMPETSAAEVELEMDMEVKSELDSESESSNSNISVTSSVEIVKSEHCQSEEELEEEPLVELESVMVPQQLVEVDLEPTLLLFVNKDCTKMAPTKRTVQSHDLIEKTTVLTDEKSTQTDKINEISVTKALRNIKLKQKGNIQNTSELGLHEIKKIKKIRVSGNSLDSNSSKNQSKCPSPSRRCSLATGIEFSIEPPKRKLRILNKRVKSSKGKLLKRANHRKKKNVKPRLSEHTKKFKSLLGKESVGNSPLDKESASNRLCSREKNELETNHLVRELKGKENTQYNNEDPNTKEGGLRSTQNDIVKSVLENKIEENPSNGVKDTIKPSKPESYDCMVCGKQFREKSHLATHTRAHIDIRNFKCNECGNLFKTKTNLFYHMKTHEAPFVCTKCNKTFPEKKMFTRHMRVVHSGEGLYNCDVCGRPFKSAHNLELHYTLHTGNKPFSCNICCKSFVYKSTYRAHMKSHEADEQFSCELCLVAGSQDKGDLRKRCIHYSQARPWLCTVCGKAYPLKATLKNHMKSHEPEKPFKCNECGKFFMKRQTYESHLKTHSSEHPQYMCDQCSQSYYSAMSLKRHYMKHTSERRFFCDMCNKAFWTKDAMKVHRRSHENVKMFQCTQCSKAFAHKHTLVAHSRTHSGEPIYSCDVCCKTFLHKYHLTRHLRQHSVPIAPTSLPLTYMPLLPPHNHHLDMPTLQIL